MSRKVLFVINAEHPTAFEIARSAAEGLLANGIAVACSDGDEGGLELPQVSGSNDAAGCELVIVFGGDGTILRGVEIARDHDVPVFSVNLGHVGFLAEAEAEDIEAVINTVVNKEWSVEERTALAIHVTDADGRIWDSWALNEVAIEKYSRGHMTKLLVNIDERPVSHWSCDGVLVATPTGSTAYAFSAGGPIVWPEVEAMLVVPISAHALFAKPLVVSPKSVVELVVTTGPVEVGCDRRRKTELATGATIRVVRNTKPVKLARIHLTPFTERLVAKFELPVHGWRAK
jgi:NAD+ kinase